MPLTDLDVHEITCVSATNQRGVQARRPMVLAITPIADRCIGHQILEAATVVAAEFGNDGVDYLANADNARLLLERITGLVFDADVVYKNSASSSVDKTVTAPAYEPATEWWRSYFVSSAATTVTVLVD
jgi:hypothetical protein